MAPVRTEVVERLLDLNREFYQSFADEFAETRRRIQPGVQRIVRGVPRRGTLLDLGCGHGELAAHLQRTGFKGHYVGIDSSPALLELVAPELTPPHYLFLRADLARHGWSEALEQQATAGRSAWPPFGFASAFAVLHHLPGAELRSRTLTELRRQVKQGAQVFLSVWDFVASPKLRGRIRPWSELELEPDQVDPSDYLLDWRRGGRGLRYVHHFDSLELRALAESTGYQVLDEFRSDGEGGRLGLYQTWQAV